VCNIEELSVKGLCEGLRELKVQPSTVFHDENWCRPKKSAPKINNVGDGK
jgi:hypothetical protein